MLSCACRVLDGFMMHSTQRRLRKQQATLVQYVPTPTVVHAVLSALTSHVSGVATTCLCIVLAVVQVKVGQRVAWLVKEQPASKHGIAVRRLRRRHQAGSWNG